MATTTSVAPLNINYLTQTQYDSITKNDDEIYITLDDTKDYVIDTNTSGIWTYKKWQSGLVECYGQWSGTLTNYMSVLNGRGYNVQLNFPSGLFIDVPFSASYSARAGNAFALTGTITTGLTKDHIIVYALSGTTGSLSCSFNVQVTGMWK